MEIIKIGAIWCAGCLVMKPIWKDIENENTWLKTKYFDFDLDKNEIKEYNIDTKLPCFIFLDKSGNEIERITGEYSKIFLLEKIEKLKNL